MNHQRLRYILHHDIRAIYARPLSLPNRRTHNGLVFQAPNSPHPPRSRRAPRGWRRLLQPWGISSRGYLRQTFLLAALHIHQKMHNWPRSGDTPPPLFVPAYSSVLLDPSPRLRLGLGVVDFSKPFVTMYALLLI